MARARAILQSQFPYQISARCINREWFQIPMPQVWEIFHQQLVETVDKYELQIHSFILMSNHFHLIASTPQANISKSMWHFMSHTSRRLTRAGNRINESFAGRHYKCVLSETAHYRNAYKYNYRNPVTAGICERVEDYPYSTLQGLTGRTKPKIPLIEDILFMNDPKGTLNWLNTAPDPQKLEAVRFGLKRPIFQSKKCRLTNQPLIGPNDIL